MAGPHRRVRGAANVQRLLRAAPEAARVSVLTEFHRAGPEILKRMQGRAPHKTGALRRGLSYKVLTKSLRLLIGLIGTPSGRSKLFYAKIQEFGRKAQTASVRRVRAGGQRIISGGKKVGGDVQTYQMRVPAMAGKRFVTGRMRDLRSLLGGNLRTIWKRALGRIVNNPI